MTKIQQETENKIKCDYCSELGLLKDTRLTINDKRVCEECRDEHDARGRYAWDLCDICMRYAHLFDHGELPFVYDEQIGVCEDCLKDLFQKCPGCEEWSRKMKQGIHDLKFCDNCWEDDHPDSVEKREEAIAKERARVLEIELKELGQLSLFNTT